VAVKVMPIMAAHRFFFIAIFPLVIWLINPVQGDVSA